MDFDPAKRLEEIAQEARSMSIEVLKFRRKYWTSLARMYKGWGVQHIAPGVAATYAKEIKRRAAKGA